MFCDYCSGEEDGEIDCASGCDCHCHDNYGIDDDLGDGPCIGADCCNPAIDHRRDECCTVEQMAAYHAEGEASAEEKVKP